MKSSVFIVPRHGHGSKFGKFMDFSPPTLLCTLKIKFVLCGLTFRACESFVLVVAEFETPTNHGMQTLDAKLTFADDVTHSN